MTAMSHSYPPAITIEDFRNLCDAYARTIELQSKEIGELKKTVNNLNQKLNSKKGKAMTIQPTQAKPYVIQFEGSDYFSYLAVDAALCIIDWFATRTTGTEGTLDLDRFGGFAGVRNRTIEYWGRWVDSAFVKAKHTILENPDEYSICFDLEFVPEVMELVEMFGAWDDEAFFENAGMLVLWRSEFKHYYEVASGTRLTKDTNFPDLALLLPSVPGGKPNIRQDFVRYYDIEKEAYRLAKRHAEEANRGGQ